MTLAERLAALERTAKAATPGPWHITLAKYTWLGIAGPGRQVVPTGASLWSPDATHIAACSPDAILALVADVRRLERVLGSVVAAMDMWETDASTDDEALDRLSDLAAQARRALDGGRDGG